MSGGFGENKKATVVIDDIEVAKLLKEYKKIKKYQKSSLYQVKTMDGTEEIVSKLIENSGLDDI